MGCNSPGLKPLSAYFPYFSSLGYCAQASSAADNPILVAQGSQIPTHGYYRGVMLSQCGTNDSVRIVGRDETSLIFEDYQVNRVHALFEGREPNPRILPSTLAPSTRFQLNGAISTSAELGALCLFKPAFVDAQNNIADVAAFNRALRAFSQEECPRTGLKEEQCWGVRHGLEVMARSSAQAEQLFPGFITRHSGFITALGVVASLISFVGVVLGFHLLPRIFDEWLVERVSGSPRLQAFLDRHPLLRRVYERSRREIEQQNNRRPPDDPSATAPVTEGAVPVSSAPVSTPTFAPRSIVRGILAQTAARPLGQPSFQSHTVGPIEGPYLSSDPWENLPAPLRGLMQFVAPVVFTTPTASSASPALVPSIAR